MKREKVIEALEKLVSEDALETVYWVIIRLLKRQ